MSSFDFKTIYEEFIPLINNIPPTVSSSIKNCTNPNCNKEYESRHPDSTVCSDKCSSIVYNHLYERFCKNGCGRFVVRAAKKKQKTCSKKCFNNSGDARRNPNIVKTCQRAGCTNTFSTSREDRKHCSDECRYPKDTWLTCVIDTCGKKFPPRKEYEQYCCSVSCRLIYNKRKKKKEKILVSIKSIKIVKSKKEKMCEREGCTVTFPLKNKSKKSYCSDRCRWPNKYRELECDYCHEMFNAGKRRNRKDKKDRKDRKDRKHNFCNPECSRLFQIGKPSLKKGIKTFPKICARDGCTNIFTPKPVRNHKREITCSVECKEIMWEQKKELRHMEKYGTPYKPERYYDFKFDIYNYPDLFDLERVKELGWYSVGNRKKPENKGGLTRDHRVSVSESWKNKYEKYYITHPINCELLTNSENSSKKSKCSITYEQLVQEVNAYDRDKEQNALKHLESI